MKRSEGFPNRHPTKLTETSLMELWQLFPIILKEHNPYYETWYETERASLNRILQDFHVFRINHIGSTSVADLIAKPIIDILLELDKTIDREILSDVLENNGWLVMAHDESAHTLDLNKGYTPQGFAEKVFHLHIKPIDDWDELYFRDYLRSHHDIAQAYGYLKLQLKGQYEHDRDGYTAAKSEFIHKYTQAARVEFPNHYNPKPL